MPERNVVSWTTMVLGYARNGLLSKHAMVFPEKSRKKFNVPISNRPLEKNTSGGQTSLTSASRRPKVGASSTLLNASHILTTFKSLPPSGFSSSSMHGASNTSDMKSDNLSYGGMEVVGEGEDASSKFYFKWNDEIDACLTTSLIEQMEKGYKVERNFTNVAYSATCHVLEETFETKFTIENVKHMLKTLKKQLAVFQDMQNSTSGFSFNIVTKMMDAEPTVWDAYLKDRVTDQGSETAKERHICLERERYEVNIDDQDTLNSVEKETSAEQYEGSMGMQGDETIASKFDYKSFTGKAYAKRKAKAESFKEEFQILKNGMDVVASAISRCASRMIVTEEQLYEEVQKIDGLTELSQIIAYDFLCGDANRGRTFIGLPLTRKKLWLEFKLGHPLE